MKMDLDKNSKISVSEILNNSGNNPIADLFINDDGTVDRALIIAMGGNMGGAISPTLFEKNNEIAMYIDKVSVYQSTYVNEKYLKK